MNRRWIIGKTYKGLAAPSATHDNDSPKMSAAREDPTPMASSTTKDAFADDVELKDPTQVDTQHADDQSISPQEDKRVQRKIDRVVMSMTAAVYFMQYLDKRGLAFAAIFGMREDLNLQGQEYS